MSILCAACRRQLARAAVTGNRPDPDGLLGRHLARCASCGAAADEYRVLTAMLSAEPPFPPARPGFSERLAARCASPMPLPRARLTFRVTAIAAASVLLAVMLHGFAVIHTPNAGAPTLVQLGSPTQHAAPARISLTRPDVAPMLHPARFVPVTSSAVVTIHHTWHRRRSRRPHESPGAPVLLPIAEISLPLETIGAICKDSGDYGDAERAYAAAYHDHADPNLAYSAGECAEQAGDMAAAMDYYAELLTPAPDAPDSSGKGSN